MSKLVGIITAWGAEPFIEPAIKQGLEYCDELIVSVSENHPAYHKFADNTMEICQKYGNQIKLVEGMGGSDHPSSKGNTMIKMLNDTNNNKKDTWIWILDADEFYFEADLSAIRDLIKEDYVKIELPEKFFLINMSYYIKTSRSRIKRIPMDNMTTIRTNILGNEGGKTHVLETEDGMHHYSFLLNPYFKREFWTQHYGGLTPETRNYIKWLDHVYLQFEPDNQEEYIGKCKELFNQDHILGPLFNKETTNNGYLFEYQGDYPKHIKEAGLHEINDFREIYLK